MPKKPEVSSNLDDLLQIMARLRDPEDGCPWDQEQDFASIAPYTIEEAYEVAEAIRLEDMEMLRDELGDLLFQVVYHARMAEEAGDFDFSDVVTSISEKMLRRHPHVFADTTIENAAAQTEAWEQQKAGERAARGADGNGAESAAAASVLDDVPLALPALLRAYKLQKRAARVGFDWPDIAQVIEKIGEEMQEIGEAMAALAAERSESTLAGVADELGDLLFACANLGRHLGLDPEQALRGGNVKFERRFRYMEEHLLKNDQKMEDVPLAILEVLWRAAKESERPAAGRG